MTYILIGLAVVIVVSIAFAVIFSKLYKKYKSAYEQEKSKLELLQEEYSKLAEAYKIKKGNKEKADEKIDDLHSGKLSADDILPKRKG